MTSVHCLQHVERFRSATLTKDDTIGSHSKRVFEEISLKYLSFSFQIAWPGLETDNVRLLELELRGVFDRYDALAMIDHLAHGIQ